MSEKFYKDVMVAQKMATEFHNLHPYMDRRDVLMMAFIHINSTSDKAKAQAESGKKLTDEEKEQIVAFISISEFYPMMMSEIYFYATGRSYHPSLSRALHVLLSEHGITRTQKSGRVRYSKASSRTDPAKWAVNLPPVGHDED